jgi:hypothetical protein
MNAPRMFPPLPAAATGSRAINSASQANPDAELIRICHRFAETEFEQWYRWEAVPGNQDMPPQDWDTYHWIVATPAATPEGWHAKALAYVAWDRAAYDDCVDKRDQNSCTTFLASLLRDMVAPVRNAIVARCAAQYGPLPHPFSAEAIWLGYPPEEIEASMI